MKVELSTEPFPNQQGMEDKAIISLKMDEATLVKNLRARCPKTFRKFHGMYSAAVLGIIYRIVKSEELAEDLMQEAFVKIWNALDGYDASKGRLFTWIASTARNLAIDYMRSKACNQAARRSPLEDVSPDRLLHYQTSFNADVIGVKNLIEHLTVSERSILDLLYFQGYTQMEVADQLSIPLGTVKTRCRLAIKRLRNYFEIEHVKDIQTA